MAVPASRDVAILQGNVRFTAGGIYTSDLIGATIATIDVNLNGNIVITGQTADGLPLNATLLVPGTSTEIRDIHYTLDLVYVTAENRFEGTLFYGDTDDLTTGNLLVFNVPLDRPNVATRANIKLVSQANNILLFDHLGNVVYVRDLIPGRNYMAVRTLNGLRLFNPTGEVDVVRSVERTITNAEIKMLDTDYIELIPAPGAGKFISLNQVSISKDGNDIRDQVWIASAIWSSTSAVVIDSEAEAAYLKLADHLRVDDWEDTGESRYLYIIWGVDAHPIVGLTSYPSTDPDEFDFLTNFTEIAGGITVPYLGVNHDYRLYRSNVTYTSKSGLGQGAHNWFPMKDLVTLGASGYVNASPSINSASAWTRLGIFSILDGSMDKPLFFPRLTGGQLSGDHEVEPLLENIPVDMFSTSSFARVVSVGGQELIENSGYYFGLFRIGARINQFRIPDSSYSAEAWDGYLAGVDDVTFDISIRYQILGA